MSNFKRGPGRPRGPKKVSVTLDATLVADVDRSLERLRAMVGKGLRLTRTDLLEAAIRRSLREQTVCSTDPADARLGSDS